MKGYRIGIGVLMALIVITYAIKASLPYLITQSDYSEQQNLQIAAQAWADSMQASLVSVKQQEKEPNSSPSTHLSQKGVDKTASIPPTPPRSERVFELIEINHADSISLETLPGIGPVLAARILKYRDLLGGYYTKDQLLEVYGMKQEFYNLFKDKIKIDANFIQKKNLNAVTSQELYHPYLKDKQQRSTLLFFRQSMGKIQSWKELVDNKVLIDADTLRLQHYFVIE